MKKDNVVPSVVATICEPSEDSEPSEGLNAVFLTTDDTWNKHSPRFQPWGNGGKDKTTTPSASQPPLHEGN